MAHFHEISRVGFLGVLGNIFLMCIKMISGILFSSQAMIADAVNSLMDIFASFMTMMGGKIANQPRDADHHFGHGKAEFIFSLLVSLSMILGAFFILKDSVEGILYGHEVQFSALLLIVCVITILTKFILYICTKKVYVKTNSLLVYSNLLDHRNDMIVTSFTFLSVLFSFFQIELVDSIVGVGISLWICYSGILIFKDSYNILMDQALNSEESQQIKDFILKDEAVLDITKFETAPMGAQYILILSILVDGNLPTYQSHAIADQLEKNLLSSFPNILSVTIHVNPKLSEK